MIIVLTMNSDKFVKRHGIVDSRALTYWDMPSHVKEALHLRGSVQCEYDQETDTYSLIDFTNPTHMITPIRDDR